MDRAAAIERLKRVEQEVRRFRESLENGEVRDTEDLIRATATLDFVYTSTIYLPVAHIEGGE